MEPDVKITDEEIMKKIATGKGYCVFFYKAGPNRDLPEAEEDKLQMEHLRHLFRLKAEGKLLVNGPVTDDPVLKGVGIFNTVDKEEVKAWLDEDPKVKAGWLVYEIHQWFGIPGDGLPA
jgi:uncharacterized protein YciI